MSSAVSTSSSKPSLAPPSRLPPPPPHPPGLFSLSTFVLIAALFLISFLTDALSKDVLRHHSIPLTLSLSQFAVSALAALVYLLLTSTPLPSPSLSVLSRHVLPTSLCHGVGFVLTNLSLAYLPVAFTHTIKASESLFTALLSWLVLGQRLGARLVLALMPIVGGVAVSSWTEGEWGWAGLGSALGSNALFASRSILTARGRKEARKGERPLDDVQLYLLLSTLAALLVAPLWAATERAELPPMVRPAMHAASTLMNASWPISAEHLWSACRSSLLLTLLLNGALHYAYNQCSLFLLTRLSPLTHVVVNACRRLFVIYVSVAWYGVPLTRGNVVGTFILIAGVLWFGYEKTQLDARERQRKAV